MSEATAVPSPFAAFGRREPEALAALFPLVYEDLRRLARSYFRSEPADHTLQPTALVSELYLRLVGSGSRRLASREEFFGFAATLLREILVDHARARRALKRGGQELRIPLETAGEASPLPGLDPESLLSLHGALERLAAIEPRTAKVVELRYFLGLTQQETAEVLAASLATVERDWAFARRFLARELSTPRG